MQSPMFPVPQPSGVDLDIMLRVKNNLYWDLAVPKHRIDVEVANGWVTISGVVERDYERSCAEADARHAAGVVGVDNLIAVQPPS